jgi:GNAT superfamily N-acetyltransferase
MQYLPASSQQLNQFYKQNKDKARAKPHDFMYAAINDEGQTCAVLRLLKYDISYDTFLFLRSVLTASDHRGQGIASNLILHALKHHEVPIYTLPTPLAIPLYQRLGFEPVMSTEIPAPLLASYRRFRHGDKDSRVMVINTRVG